MSPVVRRPLALALAASLLLHLAVLVAPAWRLPWDADETTARALDATLIVPVRELSRSAPLAPPQRKSSVTRPPVPDALPRAEPLRGSEQSLSPPEPLPTWSPVTAPAISSPAPSSVESPSPVAAPPVPAFAATWPPRGRIRYTVTRGDSGFLVGQAEHRWQHDGENYQLRAITETIGLAALFKPVAVVQESRGIFVAAGLQPLEFKSERDGKLKASVRFDPAQKSIFSSGGGSDVMTEQTQDMLSLFYQLGAVPRDATGFFVTVATGRKVERYTLTALETLVLDTPFGARTVQHLKLPGAKGGGGGGEPGGESDDSTEIWLDTQTRLPLKIRHRDRKGEVFDQTATAVELENPE